MNNSPPLLLEKAFRCERWKTLPRPGGLDEQPIGLIVPMEMLENVYRTYRDKSTGAGSWAKNSPAGLVLWGQIETMRQELNGHKNH